MRAVRWSIITVPIGVLLTLLSKCMGLASGCGITGAIVVLLGSIVLIGDQFPCFHRVFSWMSRRCGAIEKGLGLLSGDLGKPRYLKEGQPGFQEILEVIAQRGPKLERTEFSAIRYGGAGAEGSAERVHVHLESKTNSTPLYDFIATREAFERWLYDSRYKSLSLCGFSFVFCRVFLGVVSLIMQALESGSC